MEKYKFSSLEYAPTDFEALRLMFSENEKNAKDACSSEELDRILSECDSALTDESYNATLAFIHSSLDASSEEWKKRTDYESQGDAMLDTSSFFSAILSNPFYPELEEKYGKELGEKLKKRVSVLGKAQNERAEEANLVSQYQREKAMVRIEYDGKERSEGEFSCFGESPERSVRISSRKALYRAFLEKKDAFASLLERLVALRDKIARENGFANYLEYMDVNYGRSDYGEKELDAFVEEVKKYAVPVLKKIHEETKVRLGLDKMTSADVNIMFPDGNARPKGDAAFLTNAARTMYSGLSDEMGEFFSGMVESDSIDVGFSPNKVAGMGFCTELRKGMYPFVFGSMDGTASDVAVFTHEVGHAWQVWKSDPHLIIVSQFIGLRILFRPAYWTFWSI